MINSRQTLEGSGHLGEGKSVGRFSHCCDFESKSRPTSETTRAAQLQEQTVSLSGFQHQKRESGETSTLGKKQGHWRRESQDRRRDSACELNPSIWLTRQHHPQRAGSTQPEDEKNWTRHKLVTAREGIASLNSKPLILPAWKRKSVVFGGTEQNPVSTTYHS